MDNSYEYRVGLEKALASHRVHLMQTRSIVDAGHCKDLLKVLKEIHTCVTNFNLATYFFRVVPMKIKKIVHCNVKKLKALKVAGVCIL